MICAISSLSLHAERSPSLVKKKNDRNNGKRYA